ncbi:VRR-NUC domain-containing protein [Enterococcus olivae]
METEKDIETYFKKQITKAGGLCLKFTSPGVRGVPDRIAIFKGKTFFVELKRPGQKPRKDQEKMAKTFEKHGVKIYVIDTKTEAELFALKMKVGDL